MVKKLSWTMVKKLRMKISFVLSGSAKRSEKFGFFGSALSSFETFDLTSSLHPTISSTMAKATMKLIITN